MKKEKCFACNKKAKRKKKKIKTLGNIQQGRTRRRINNFDRCYEHLSDQWLCSMTKKYQSSLLKKNLKFSLKERFDIKKIAIFLQILS